GGAAAEVYGRIARRGACEGPGAEGNARALGSGQWCGGGLARTAVAWQTASTRAAVVATRAAPAGGAAVASAAGTIHQVRHATPSDPELVGAGDPVCEGGQGPPAVGPVVGNRGDREPEGRGDRVDAGGGGGQDQRQGDGVGRGQGTDVRSAHPTPWPARTRFVRGLVVGLRPVIANGVACEVGHGCEGRGGRVGGHAQSSGT